MSSDWTGSTWSYLRSTAPTLSRPISLARDYRYGNPRMHRKRGNYSTVHTRWHWVLHAGILYLWTGVIFLPIAWLSSCICAPYFLFLFFVLLRVFAIFIRSSILIAEKHFRDSSKVPRKIEVVKETYLCVESPMFLFFFLSLFTFHFLPAAILGQWIVQLLSAPWAAATATAYLMCLSFVHVQFSSRHSAFVFLEKWVRERGSGWHVTRSMVVGVYLGRHLTQPHVSLKVASVLGRLVRYSLQVIELLIINYFME